MNRKSLGIKTIAVMMSFLLAIVTLMPVATDEGRAYAEPTPPYTPTPEVVPDFTGPLTWVDYSEPMVTGNLPLAGMPYFMDIDDQDNMFITRATLSLGNNTPGGKVEMISNDGQTVTDITYNASLNYPIGIAVDHDGNLFIANNSTMNQGSHNNSNVVTIWKLQAGTDTWVNITHGVLLKYAIGVATDHQGNVYVVDSTMNNYFDALPAQVFKLSEGDTSWTNISNSQFTDSVLIDIAADGAGNLYVSSFPKNMNQSSTGQIYKLPVGEVTWEDVTPTLVQGEMPLLPYGIHVDPFDNLYTVNFINNVLHKLPYNGGKSDWTKQEMTPTTPNVRFFDVATDSQGYLYGTNIGQLNIGTLLAAVQYDGNGQDSGATEPTAGYRPGETAIIAGQDEMVKAGHTFAGWNTKADGSGTPYAAGATITMTQSVELHAVWTPIPTTSVQLDRTSYTLSIGDTHQSVLTANLSDESADIPISGVTYTSSDVKVATVNEEGLVTAKASGQTVIKAVYQDLQAEATVTVRSNSSTDTPSTPVTNLIKGIEIIVDGVKQGQLATAKEETVDGVTKTTVQLDSQKVIDKLSREKNKRVTIPVSGDSKVVVGELSGSLVQTMQAKDAVLEIVTDRATYTLPASQISLDDISKQLGKDVKLEDATIRIVVSETPSDRKEQVDAAAKDNNYQVVAAPIDFEIEVSYGSQTIGVNRFNSYVERKIALPEGVDSNGITTGVVLTEDGELFHVPTYIVQEDGNTYAVVNSLTNSTYSVIYNPQEMNDVKGHWAQADVDDMSSRLIILGVSEGQFQPDAPITRAEFAAILTRGLGIQGQPYTDGFADVLAGGWQAEAIQAATEYGWIDGYGDGSFRPDQSITRQEAAVILARAAGVTKLRPALSADDANRLLSGFADGESVASWARQSVATAIGLHLLHGRGDALDLEARLTRAEAAAIVRRLLLEAELINP